MPSLLWKWKQQERKTSSQTREHDAGLQSLKSEDGKKFGEVLESALDQFVIDNSIDIPSSNDKRE